MDSVLLTGASGFLGYHVAKRLNDAGIRPRVLELRDGRPDVLSRINVERCAGYLDDPAAVRGAVEHPIASYLHSESWQSGMPLVTYLSGAGMTPFLSARAAHLATFDRTAIASRTFEDVTGTIERYDTFAELVSGMATVRLAATVVTTDAAGRTERQPTARRVKVFFGNWVPEVVDEELTPGVWRSGGDLALIDIDVSRA